MQSVTALIIIMVVLFGAAAVLPAFAGLLVLCGLGVGFFAALVALANNNNNRRG